MCKMGVKHRYIRQKAGCSSYIVCQPDKLRYLRVMSGKLTKKMKRKKKAFRRKNVYKWVHTREENSQPLDLGETLCRYYQRGFLEYPYTLMRTPSEAKNNAFFLLHWIYDKDVDDNSPAKDSVIATIFFCDKPRVYLTHWDVTHFSSALKRRLFNES